MQNTILVECGLCKKLFPMEELNHLDIVENNIKALSNAILYKKQTSELSISKHCESLKKFNINPTDIFCDKCKKKIERDFL